MDKDGIKGKSTQQIINDRIAGGKNGWTKMELKVKVHNRLSMIEQQVERMDGQRWN